MEVVAMLDAYQWMHAPPPDRIASPEARARSLDEIIARQRRAKGE